MTASQARSMLPPLSEEERRHSQALAALICGELVAAGGWLSFERFMDLALYTPGLGYYSAGSAKLGAGGDFATAPEISPLFGRCVARPCAAVLAAIGGDGQILELGAGTGSLAAALLPELAALDALPERYAILEVSADLAARQRARLAQLPAHLHERVTWLERLPERPLSGVMLANEVADALPVRRFTSTEAGISELGVVLASSSLTGDSLGRDGISFREQGIAADAIFSAACEEALAAVPATGREGYTSELCLRLEPWIASLSDCLGQGLLLLCDYGLPRRHYYHPQRAQGTLRCHYRQRAHDDPYINLGVQDITAWVDFTRAAEAACASGLTVGGFCTQAAFLLACGIEELVAAAPDDLSRARLAGEARRLLMPEEMGEAFKAMALTRDSEVPLPGFALQDLRRLL
jgi:SAM-dependent MidA family methyltransferase